MHFLQWFHRYSRWDTITWLAIVGFGAVWEILGAIGKHETTFTDLCRSATLVWLRAVIIIVLFWHFVLQKANWQ